MIFTEMRLHVYHFNLREILSSLLTRHSHILCVNEVKNFLRGGTAAAAERAKIVKLMWQIVKVLFNAQNMEPKTAITIFFSKLCYL